ncbi:MAG: response regulator transcription factor [Candidatus Didemnitutus sp.]|jgi:two-component system NarL family response regulator|nr:response regulator transcription factor [Candidatus Didemnitutus sp.]
MKKPPAPAIKVMIVEDHPTFRMGLASLIDSQPGMKVVAQYASGEEAIAAYQPGLASVVLMDLRLPGIGGVETIIALRARDPEVRVVVLTTYDADEDVFRAMQSGARSYLLKDMSTEEIAGTLRSVHQGSTEVPPRVAERLAERAQRQSLSPREQEVLQLLVRGRSNKEIGAQLFISEETVKSHLKTLFAKLKVRDRTDAVISAVRHGIVHLE